MKKCELESKIQGLEEATYEAATELRWHLEHQPGNTLRINAWKNLFAQHKAALAAAYDDLKILEATA
jgi:hypothetical protein